MRVMTEMEWAYKQEGRRMARDILDLAGRAESMGFPLLAAEILDFGVELEYSTAPVHRGALYNRRMDALNTALYALDTGWRALCRDRQKARLDPIRPTAYEAARALARP